MRNQRITIILPIILFVISACSVIATEEPSLPTLVPTPSPAPPTNTPAPTTTLVSPPTLPPEATLVAVPQTNASNPAQQAFVRVVHAAPDVPQLDVYAEFAAIATNLGFQQSTQPSGIVEGDYTLRVVPTGNAPEDNTLFETSLSVKGGNSLILLFTGTTDALNLSLFTESNEPLDGNQSRLTIIHAIPRGPDFIITESNAAITPLLVFGQASPPVVLSSGRTLLSFQSGEQTVLTHEINLQERRNHTLLLVGRPDDLDNLSIIEFSNQAPGRANMRVINASAPVGPIDVYLNGVFFTGDVTFGRTSPREEIIIDNYIAEVFRRGEDPTTASPLTSSQININPDDDVVLIFVGEGQTARLVTYRESLAPTAPNTSRITFFNPLDSVPQVRLTSITDSGGDLDNMPDLGYAQTPFTTETESGSYDFIWDQIENGVATDTVEEANDVRLEAGHSYLYLMTGQFNQPLILEDNVGIDESLAVVDTPPTAIPTPALATRVRFVNAVSLRSTVDFQMDEIAIASAIEFGQDSDLIIVDPGVHTLILRAANTGTILTSADVTFDEGNDFSVFAYMDEADSFMLFVVPDFNLTFDGDSAHIRVINLTSNDNVGVSRFAGGNLESFISSMQEEPGLRPSVPFDGREVLAGVQPFSFSNLAVLIPEEYDLALTDSAQNRMIAILSNINLEARAHYDLVLIPEIDFQRMFAFSVVYPFPGGQ
ncbi:MAG: DUF4397 domain-containing protein [Chloroflexi bacterium]|nr:MAG: hypothetical protein CUN54_05085 [Phototrophicales bacterium]RMF81981.1 MAG: DUF4397 domain-containing protein [Chloroflexota bacterium]